MDWRVRALTAMFMTVVMVAMVTLIVTWLNLGFDPGFMRQWGKAFLIAWADRRRDRVFRDAGSSRTGRAVGPEKKLARPEVDKLKIYNFRLQSVAVR